MSSCALADVAINAVNFPDANFRAYVADSLDIFSDGVITDYELTLIHIIDVNDRNISSLKGIENFPNLLGLSCNNNSISELDLTSNTSIMGVFCSNNNITTLNLSNQHNLIAVQCFSNKMTSLNLDGCEKLVSLDCSLNSLTHLNVKSSTALGTLDCRGNDIEELDLSGLASLKYLDCAANYWVAEGMTLTGGIASLNLSGCTALEEINCNSNAITTLDVSGFTRLKTLDCGSNTLETLNASGCSALTNLTCSDNALVNLNLDGCIALGEIDCNTNQLTSLDVSGLSSLTSLRCSRNRLVSLELNTALKTIWCSDNNLSDIDITQNKDLLLIQCDGNNLTSINTSNNKELLALACGNNNLTALDIAANTELETLACEYNHIPALDLSQHQWLGYSSNAEVKLDHQSVKELDVKFASDSGSSYLYYVDFRDYVPSELIGKIIASYVQGLDEDNIEIDTVYDNGIARFSASPARVRYVIDTGFNGLSMDVTVGTMYYASLSLNNHVYRVFSPAEAMTWQEAKDYCESLGGHLVTITSEEENKLVAELIDLAWLAGEPQTLYWLGGHYDDQWKWVTDEEFSYKPMVLLRIADTWNYLRTSFNYQLWVASTGNMKLGFICEWDPVPADFAQYSEEYQRYVENPDAYTTDENFQGMTPEARNMEHLSANPPEVEDVIELPAQYDPRSSNVLPAVKDQGTYGTCWTFASLGALETSYNAQGLGSSAPDLAELHMAWYVYKDPRPKYAVNYDESKSPLMVGGTYAKAVAFLARASTASESDIPYDNISQVEELTAGKLPENYQHPIRLAEAYELNAVTEANRDEIKRLVYKYGAVSIAYDNNSEGYSGSSYYFPSAKGWGHAVMIVGWNDDYSASNFGTNPGTNGAWLVKNSWGDSWGDNGYFWMSYAQNIGSSAVFIAASSKVNSAYGNSSIAAVDSIPHRWSASIFKADKNESLNEVSFQTIDNNVGYEIYINTLGTSYPVNPGSPENVIASGKIPYAGYHTISLASPVEIEKDQYFSVIVKLTPSSSRYAYVTAVEDTGFNNNVDGGVVAAGVITVAGKSYFALNDTKPVSADWEDGKRLVSEGKNRSCAASIKIFSAEGGNNPGGNNPGEEKPGENNPGEENPGGNDPQEQENSNSSSGGGGGGGCVTSSGFAGLFAALFILSRKRH